MTPGGTGITHPDNSDETSSCKFGTCEQILTVLQWTIIPTVRYYFAVIIMTLVSIPIPQYDIRKRPLNDMQIIHLYVTGESSPSLTW